MKKITITFAIILLVSSCGSAIQLTTETEPQTTISLFADYSKYSEEGFLITPYQYTMDYKSIGEFHIIVSPEKGYYKIPDEKNPNWYSIEYKSKELSLDELIEIAVNCAKGKGADAITNFRIDIDEQSNTYHAKGFCIKRNNDK